MDRRELGYTRERAYRNKLDLITNANLGMYIPSKLGATLRQPDRYMADEFDNLCSGLDRLHKSMFADLFYNRSLVTLVHNPSSDTKQFTRELEDTWRQVVFFPGLVSNNRLAKVANSAMLLSAINPAILQGETPYKLAEATDRLLEEDSVFDMHEHEAYLLHAIGYHTPLFDVVTPQVPANQFIMPGILKLPYNLRSIIEAPPSDKDLEYQPRAFQLKISQLYDRAKSLQVKENTVAHRSWNT